ncbi:MAG: hypothetical protein ACKVQU_04650 [Burkholderiales bacterium]
MNVGKLNYGSPGAATVPRGLELAIAARVSEAVRAVLAEDHVHKRYAEMGAILVGNPPAELGDRVQGEAVSWKAIIAKTGARADH